MNNDEGTTQVVDGVSIRLDHASLGKRFVAYCIDMGIVGLVMYFAFLISTVVIAILAGTVVSLSEASSDAAAIGFGILLILLVLVLLLLNHAYFVFFEYKRGATLGKRVLGLRTVDVGGGRPSLGQCVMRDLARYIDCLLLFPGPIAILLSEKRQRLGDMMAQTCVVYSARVERSQRSLYLPYDRYVQLVAEVGVPEVPQHLRHEFMAYAFGRFVRPVGRITGNELDLSWLERIVHDNGSTVPAGIEPEEGVRFFAESCARSDLKSYF